MSERQDPASPASASPKEGVSTSDPRVEALTEVIGRRFGSAGEADVVLARELLAALDAVPAPDREKVAEALKEILERDGEGPGVSFLDLADAAIAAGAGTGLTPEEAEGVAALEHNGRRVPIERSLLGFVDKFGRVWAVVPSGRERVDG